MDDAQPTVDVLGERLRVGVSDAVVAADDDRKRSRVEDVRDPRVDLVERLLDVGRDDKDVGDVTDRDFLEQIHAKVGAV